MDKKKITCLSLVLISLSFCPRAWAGEVELLEKIKINEELFTQGLELSPDHEIVMGTGLKGQSKIGKFDLSTGKLKDTQSLPHDYFGEGITYTPDALWQLTWKEKKVLKRDPKTFEVLEEKTIPTEGWGICYDAHNDVIWRSDGTSTLYKHHPKTFELLGQISIKNGKLAASKLNELEWVDGYIFANRLYRDEIFKIDCSSAEVVDKYDIRPIIDQTMNDEELAKIDSLNGIAHIKDQEFYLTGKLYPYIYKVILK
ncbi:glutaminyl-peptide cyclotransferase [Ignavigranum ruoffiae]|uniref:Glutamine cyclotransferase n=1 Tax=Ignavigranum ruoffiae TaxID=89093 RepID=A0A1H9GTL8_9LACT|nr:glutaminyl-peptide cyclotransferase [Ignavigranum ruoffiae]UPQ85954.1 glutaminyl-peptide cyclotransferase [Ignavigranum ruoffiae]SEQ53363.1 Glutamine cyclotransferase [Ignavigranum ruoffiae]